LTKPVRGRLLNELLNRLWSNPPAMPVNLLPMAPVPQFAPIETRLIESAVPPSAPQTLTLLRDFSGILTHSLDAEAMLKQFLLMLREIVSLNRAVIFMRPPPPSFGE